MTDEDAEVLLAIIRKCITLENRLLALGSLLKAKKILSDAEIAKAIRIADEARADIRRRADQSPAQALEELLRDFEGPVQ